MSTAKPGEAGKAVRVAVLAERERCIALVNATMQRLAVSRDRAKAAGRDGVASHRQSNVETCEEIISRLRDA